MAIILVALWFSYHKQQQNLSDPEQKKALCEIRKHLISDIGYLSLRCKHTLQQSFIQQYKVIAQFLKKQDNIFILSKGTGLFVSEFISYKFNQVCAIHAEAYGSAEFRHGPLAMLDEEEKTASKFRRYFYFILFSHFPSFG